MPKGKPNKRYTGEFKQMVVEAVIKEKMSYAEAARIYEVSNHHRIQSGSESIWKKVRKDCISNAEGGRVQDVRINCRRRWKRIFLQKYSVCAQKTNT